MLTSLVPFLVVADGTAAISFYLDGLAATVVKRYDQADGRIVAKLSIDGAEFWIGSEEPDFGRFSPLTFNGTPVRMVLVTPNPDGVFQKAVDHGATIICPVTTEEFWKIGQLRDPFGMFGRLATPWNNSRG